MKLTIALMMAVCLQVSARTAAQKLSFSVSHTPLEKVFATIRQQTGYLFFYNEQDLRDAGPVTLRVKEQPLAQVLDACLRGSALTYEIQNKTIVISRSRPPATPSTFFTPPVATHDLRVHITDSLGSPLQGASVVVKGTRQGGQTDAEGNITLAGLNGGEILVVSYVGYETKEVTIGDNTLLSVVLKASASILDEMQVIGYGTTTQRLSTGNVSTVTAETIAKQPVTNPLQALIGRVPGLQVIQNSGLPGDGVTVRIRGRNSIAASNNPLYIVDGVPFTSDKVETFNEGSPMNSISPNDIESISVLKDADATAIYGSRAANGVILITTKKGKAGKTRLTANVNTGFSNPSRLADVLSTGQYLQVRRDAQANSGVAATAINSPDLVTWNQNTDDNWQKWYFNNTARYTDASASVSGGTEQTTFMVSGGYHKETTVQSKDNDYQRSNVHISINHRSLDNRFHLGANAFYTAGNDYRLAMGDMRTIVTAVPNYPNYNADSTYNWALTNYLAQATSYYKSQTNNLNAGLVLDYRLLPGLTLKASLGYNRIQNDQNFVFPTTYSNPAVQTTGRSTFQSRYIQAMLFEPQLIYIKQLGKGKLDILAGATVQQNNTVQRGMNVNGYINNLLLENPSYGTSVQGTGSNIDYKYLSTFARLNYNWLDKYILNGTFRRDGSTRFAEGNKFGNFGSIGAAWLFTNEAFIKGRQNILSYGKLRGSWGTTGNDGIGDYQYLSTYTSMINYGTALAVNPSRIANARYSWEVNKKLEAAIDLGFLKDHILFSAAWYRNRSGNQLVLYSLPATSGFSGYTANLPALVQNTGWEFNLSSQHILSGAWRWDCSLNLTIPKNELLAFPNLSASTYANTYVIGQSLNIIQRYHFTGVDPQTGVATIQDVGSDNNYVAKSAYNHQGGDYLIAGTLDPKWYGGFNNTLEFKGVQLDVFFQYTRQSGLNLLSFPMIGAAGRSGWAAQLDYWKQPGDEVSLPKPMSTTTVDQTYYNNSDAGFGDASFLRLKNIMLSYNFTEKLSRKLKLNSLRLYAQGQNVWTATKYIGYDPELRGIAVPTLRTFTLGLQCSL